MATALPSAVRRHFGRCSKRLVARLSSLSSLPSLYPPPASSGSQSGREDEGKKNGKRPTIYSSETEKTISLRVVRPHINLSSSLTRGKVKCVVYMRVLGWNSRQYCAKAPSTPSSFQLTQVHQQPFYELFVYTLLVYLLAFNVPVISQRR